jgi:hypothetical protein
MASFPSASWLYTSAFQGCVNLVSLYLPGSSVCVLQSVQMTFSSTPIGGYSAVAGQFGSVFVPESLFSAYVNAAGWKTISSRIVSVAMEE